MDPIARRIFPCTALLLWILVATAAAQSGHDWPQWRGPDRTGVSTETGLLKSWPKGGPALLWTASGLGEGYGPVSVRGDRVYVQGTAGSESFVFCLERASGEMVWRRALGRKLRDGKGDGPRGAPTVQERVLYALTGAGDLACLDTSDGSVVWSLNILRDFHASNIGWGISESPLIEGDKVIVTPGGPGATVVALDTQSGATIWTSEGLSDAAGYASCVAGDAGGVRVIATMTAEAGVGLRVSDGRLLWRYSRPSNGTANVATPILYDNKVFYTTAYGTGGGLLRLDPGRADIGSRQVYFNRNMQNHHGGVVLVDGYIYGFSDSILTCLEFETGKRVWRNRSVGKGSLMAADGHLYLIGENNRVGLAEATPEGYRETGRFRIADSGQPAWAHPVVAGGRLFIRNQDTIACYDIEERD
ncbi:PQQ-like beta-propeller repeat protein [Candidatus Sumerlaeota bacterium]|nr:PQQ-like beta-propeller repeat protein [Candidatus Sumerlaeota bacterium]